MNYRAYNLRNFKKIAQLKHIDKDVLFHMEVVGNVLPFKTNNYVVDELIDWNNYLDDPLFILNFPQKEMLQDEHYERMANAMISGMEREELKSIANDIRTELNPHPAGQLEHNIPEVHGRKLSGVQHKYRETMLLFPAKGQTCHAYCTFCFRWPQFTGMKDLKIAMKQSKDAVEYIKQHHEITDVLITGGDPMIMSAKNLGIYLNEILEAKIPHLRNIRIGTKSLSFWPYRFVTDEDADEVLDLFKKVVDAGYHLAVMAHFSHPAELSTTIVQDAIEKILATGAQIRTQSPVLNHINANPGIWSDMWKKQVSLGLIPYYMFIARDTGAKDYFAVPLVKAWKIFREAYSKVSGICRTVRGPSMSANPGKIQVLGVNEFNGEKVLVLNFLQGRNPNWVGRPFFARYDEEVTWLDELKPVFGKKEFFYSQEFRHILRHERENKDSINMNLQRKIQIYPS